MYLPASRWWLTVPARGNASLGRAWHSFTVATEGSVSPWEIHVGKVGASVTAGARVCLLQELVLAKINSAAKKEKIFFLLARCGVSFARQKLPPRKEISSLQFLSASFPVENSVILFATKMTHPPWCCLFAVY
ncbi:MAG TPA: hypothetical protein DCP61_06435 [Treponema sp.]|nr:hypothetical protein [Treponema sp.]